MATVQAKGNNELKNSMAGKQEWKEGMESQCSKGTQFQGYRVCLQ